VHLLADRVVLLAEADQLGELRLERLDLLAQREVWRSASGMARPP
jgi:hypothetical protein